MSKTQVRIRLDEENFTELVQGKQVAIERDSVEVKMILADFGYTRMLDILENSLDDLSKTDGSKNWESRSESTIKTFGIAPKELSELTEVDTIELAKLSGYDVDSKTHAVNSVKANLEHILKYNVPAYQYLQSKNYKLPKYF